MAFIPVPNSASLCFDFVSAGQNWQFCLTVRKSSGSITPSDLNILSGEGHGWWTSTLKALLGSWNTLKQVRATDISVQGGAQDVDIVSEAGTASGTIMALNAPMCVSLRTQKRGRSYRGRVYVSGIVQANMNDAVLWGSGAVTAFPAAFATLQTSLDTAGFDVVVASKQHNLVTTNPAETNEVIAFTADNKIDSQRRRLSGRGT